MGRITTRLLTVCLVLLAPLTFGNPTFLGQNFTAPSGLTIRHNLLWETYETNPGRDNTWTQSATGTIDPDHTLPAGGPSGTQDELFTFSGQYAIDSYDSGATPDDTISVFFWIRVTTLPTTETHQVFETGNGIFGGDPCVNIGIEDFGTKHLLLTGSGSGQPGPDLTANTWYQVGLKITRNGACYCQVRDASGANVGSEFSIPTSNDVVCRYKVLGPVSSKTGSYEIKNFAVDSDNSTYCWQ